MAAAEPALRDQFRAAAIQAFEFTYELAFRSMKRRLEESVPVPSSVDEMTCMHVVRAAAEAGPVPGVSRHRKCREARRITSHSYDRAKAERIAAGVPRFASDVAEPLEPLDTRNHGGG